jgi:hypothetical protein
MSKRYDEVAANSATRIPNDASEIPALDWIPSTFASVTRRKARSTVNAPKAFRLFSVTAMLLCYALEGRSSWFTFAFAMSCALGSSYGFLQGAWPFGLVEGVWTLVALNKWRSKISNKKRRG